MNQRTSRRITRRALLLASTALLAAVSPVAAQQGGVQAPRLLNHADIARQIIAAYPPAQRDSGVAGHVILSFRVREDSTVDPASVSLREASNPAFAQPAATIAPRMRFAPARVGGRPMEAWTTHTVFFDVRRLGAVSAPEGTYDVSAVEEPPRLRDPERMARQIEASFPAALRDSAISGGVVVRFRIMEDGTVDPASPSMEMTTHPAFDEPAMSVIRRTRFRPGMVNGRPVKVWVSIPIEYENPGPAHDDSAGTPPGRTPPV